MVSAYATTAEFNTYVDGSLTTPTDIARLLTRASELMDDTIVAQFDAAVTTGLPTDSQTALVMRDATCAQVEFWVRAVSEDHDIEGLHSQQVSMQGLSTMTAPEVAPRAMRILRIGGMRNLTRTSTTASLFFGREDG